MSLSTHLFELLCGNIAMVLKQSNVNDAERIAKNIIETIQNQLGGIQLYIPTKDIKQRNRDIKQQFDGSNYAEICKKYSISLSTLYRIIR